MLELVFAIENGILNYRCMFYAILSYEQVIQFRDLQDLREVLELVDIFDRF